jgi:hypothetical protein
MGKTLGREFEGFGKIARLSRDMVITEKIDGTNAQIVIEPTENGKADNNATVLINTDDFGLCLVYVGSRKRWITPRDDNYGFAKWVVDNVEELIQLGPGTHFGEWWGSGVNRGYGLTNGERRFSLFNTKRWNDDNVPSCCSVVPLLYEGLFDTGTINLELRRLEAFGSVAAPGFMRPEGVIIYHVASGTYFKRTIEKDQLPKGVQE